MVRTWLNGNYRGEAVSENSKQINRWLLFNDTTVCLCLETVDVEAQLFIVQGTLWSSDKLAVVLLWLPEYADARSG